MIHPFQFQDLYIVLDVESGAVHALDKPAYDVVCAVNEGRDPYGLPYEADEVASILGELDELKRAGEFDSQEPSVPEGALDAHVIKSMCLHLAHDCNLRCRYCFADTGEFHGERMLMEREVAFRALDFLMAHSGSRRNLEVDLFGGEPLMNEPVLRDAVAYGRELEKKHDKAISFTITTNAVGLNDGLIEFINREMSNVVISLDGRREVNDFMRPTVNAKGSYDIIVPNALKLVRARGDGEHYIRGTFTSRNLDFTRDVEALTALGFQQISLEPVVLPESSPYAIREEHLEQIFEEYDRLSDLVLRRRKEGKWFNFFHFMVDFEGGPCLKKRLSGCGAGAEYVAVAPDGTLYPCHQFVGERDFAMGSVMTGTVDTAMQERFSECNLLSKPACRTCWAKYFCSGGCAANAFKYNGDIHRPHAITCALERKRAECAIGIHVKEALS